MDIEKILTTAKTIAVVGLSSNPSRASNGVASYLQREGYRIVPVRPGAETILGEKAYSSLKEIPSTSPWLKTLETFLSKPPMIILKHFSPMILSPHPTSHPLKRPTSFSAN